MNFGLFIVVFISFSKCCEARRVVSRGIHHSRNIGKRNRIGSMKPEPKDISAYGIIQISPGKQLGEEKAFSKYLDSIEQEKSAESLESMGENGENEGSISSYEDVDTNKLDELVQQMGQILLEDELKIKNKKHTNEIIKENYPEIKDLRKEVRSINEERVDKVVPTINLKVTRILNDEDGNRNKRYAGFDVAKNGRTLLDREAQLSRALDPIQNSDFEFEQHDRIKRFQSSP